MCTEIRNPRKNHLKTMDFVIVVNVALLATFDCQAAGKLIVRPRDTDVKVNETTHFNCSTDFGYRASFWYHGSKHIYIGSEILEPYDERFEIDRIVWNGTYIYNLIINSVQPGDAGTYKCAEDEGVGEEYSVQLIVLDDDPICRSNIELDGVIGQNSCNIEPDEVELECSVTYHGNIPPQVEWMQVGGNSSTPLNTLVATSGNRFTSTFKVKGDIALNNSSYVCETKQTTQKPVKCISKVIKILYALSGNSTVNGSIGDEIHCSANTSQSCSYYWRWLQDTDYTTESSTSVLKNKKPGWHRCEAECYLRNISCNLVVMRVMIVGYKEESNQTRNIIISVVVTVVLSLILACVLQAILKIYRGNKDEIPQADDELLALFELQNHPSADEAELRFKIKEEANLEEFMFRGVAILNEYLFVAHKKGSALEIYNCNNFKDSKLLRVEGLVSTEDMCSCNTNTCLYILEYKAHSTRDEILRINSEGKVLKRWQTKRGRSLSAGKEGNVIMTACYEDLLIEYSSNGDLLLEINMSCCPKPLYAIKVNMGHYIVSHCRRSEYVSRLCLVDEVGNIEKSFGGVTGTTKDQLNNPIQFAAGKRSGFVIVADAYNDRLLLLDSNLEFITEIVSKYKQKILLPYGICISETLLVVLINGGDPANSTITEADDSMEETEAGDTSTKNNERIIERDCRLLVFDIEPVLQKYFGYRKI